MDQLLKILEDVRPDVDFEHETALLDGNILDSFDMIAIVDGMDQAFGIEIDVDDLVPENFNSVQAMWELIQKLQSAQ